MRMAAVLAASLWTLAGPASAAAPTGTEKLAAWARLYGVMRWFHPTSDAAQQIDWNRSGRRTLRAHRRVGRSRAGVGPSRPLNVPGGAGQG